MGRILAFGMVVVLAGVFAMTVFERRPRIFSNTIVPAIAGRAEVKLLGWPRQLSWEGFRNLRQAPVGRPQNAAMIASRFGVPDGDGLAPIERDGRWRFERIVVFVEMDRAHSWVAEEHRSDRVLAHEQAHLDITGLAAREWIETLQQIEAASGSQALDEAERSYRQIHDKLRLVQRLYDHGSNGSREEQDAWLDRIARLTRAGAPLPEPGELKGYSAIGGSYDTY